MDLRCFGVGLGRLALGAAALAATLALLAPVRPAAEPLTADACERLRAEKGALIQAGVQGNMSKGPEWAKVSLDKARLAEIERFLDVEDAIAFRCAKPLPPEVVKAIEEETAGPADAAQPPAAAPAPVAKAKQRPPQPRTAKAAPKAAAGEGQQGAAGSDAGAVQAPAAPAPKPKVRRPPPAPKAAEPAVGEPKAQ